jgi:hypothetical protein
MGRRELRSAVNDDAQLLDCGIQGSSIDLPRSGARRQYGRVQGFAFTAANCRDVQFALRFPVLPLPTENESESVASLRRARRDAHCLAQRPGCVGKSALVPENSPEGEPRILRRGLDADAAAERFLRLRVPAELAQSLAQLEMRIGEITLEFDGALKMWQRLVKPVLCAQARPRLYSETGSRTLRASSSR